MKFRSFVLAALLTAFSFFKGFAQELPITGLADNVSLHFISPEPIQYVDISTKSISGDLPIKNVLRIKRVPDSILKTGATGQFADAVVTIAGESFIAQFKVKWVPQQSGGDYPTRIEILPEHMRPLESGVSFSTTQLERLASGLLFKKEEKNIAHTKAFGILGNINHLCTFNDYIFIDLGFTNTSNLRYDTDEVRFKIEDEKINKATTVQAIELKPEFTLFKNPAFKKNFRNIYVFRKFSFPGNKVLKIELNEKQISGRVITLKIKYRDVLEADIL